MSPISAFIRRGLFRASFALALLTAGAAGHAVADGRICISDETFEFGNRPVGSTTSANATVSNCGDAPWSFTGVSVDPATGPEFQVSTNCTTGSTLAPGDTCAASIRFAPLATGQTSGGLWLHNTTATPDPLITFYGRGIDGQSGTASLEFIPASADFPAQTVGTQSPLLDIELHNLGPAGLTMSAIILNGPDAHDFFAFGTCQLGSTIAAGDSCHMEFYFSPQAPGMRLANLVIDSPQLASLAILDISGIATGPMAPAPTVDVIEFYDAALDHYFMSSLASEIAALDSGLFQGWARTGQSFKAYPLPETGANPVCRYYMPPPLDSHFYSASPSECAIVAATYPTFVLESPNLFYIDLPDTTTGVCPPDTIPVFRLYNNRADANHRYTTDPQIKAQMISEGYIAEGYGPSATIMCAPQ
jgi:hypothetical protein